MDLTTFLFPILILLLFIPIFLSGRKQKRVAAEMQSLQASLEPGDVVMTTSGLRATVVDASYEETIDLEIADGVITTWVRAAVREKIDLAVEDAALTTVVEVADGHPDSAIALPHHDDAPSLVKSDAVDLQKDDSPNGTSRN